MRGTDQQQTHLFSTLSYDRVIPDRHPLVDIRKIVDQALAEMNQLFEGMYAQMGRPSIPPERLIRALLIETLYSIRSDRQLVQRLQYDLLTKWFVGLDLNEAVWDASTFSRNRDRFLNQKVSQEFFKRVLAEAQRRRLLSQKHFTVDGTLIQAWASIKSVRPKDEKKDDDPPGGGGGRNVAQDFHGQKRTNDTHASKTDPEALMARKADAHPARPSFMGHVMTENRNGLVVAGELTQATGTAEREAALRMADDLSRDSTVGADKAYDTADFRTGMRERGVTPHVAQNLHYKKHTSVDGRTTRHPGYAISLRRRKIVEEVFGWLKTVGNFRKARWIGTARIGWRYMLALTAYNLVRMTSIARTTVAA